MHANASLATNASVSEGPAFGTETDGPTAFRAKGLGVTKNLLTAIDFEIESARTLSRVWHAEPGGHVYLVRTLERISEHLKALHAIKAAINEADR
jgi:hypothetical protein